MAAMRCRIVCDVFKQRFSIPQPLILHRFRWILAQRMHRGKTLIQGPKSSFSAQNPHSVPFPKTCSQAALSLPLGRESSGGDPS